MLRTITHFQSQSFYLLHSLLMSWYVASRPLWQFFLSMASSKLSIWIESGDLFIPTTIATSTNLNTIGPCGFFSAVQMLNGNVRLIYWAPLNPVNCISWGIISVSFPFPSLHQQNERVYLLIQRLNHDLISAFKLTTKIEFFKFHYYSCVSVCTFTAMCLNAIDAIQVQ